MTIEVSLHGYLVGPIWQPGITCAAPITVSLTDQRDRFSEPGASLRVCILHVMMERGGDFQWCALSGDSFVTVTDERWHGDTRITRTREWPITSFPSISDCVEPDTFGCDFMGDDD